MKTIKWSVIVCVGMFAWNSAAQNYSIDWFKVAGGGGTSSNGTYQVSGTIGQPDASGAMTGGNYSLVGGYWSLCANGFTARRARWWPRPSIMRACRPSPRSSMPPRCAHFGLGSIAASAVVFDAFVELLAESHHFPECFQRGRWELHARRMRSPYREFTRRGPGGTGHLIITGRAAVPRNGVQLYWDGHRKSP
jgi:hypothetical protein